MHDNTCILSCIRPGGGPEGLFHAHYLPDVASAMAADIITESTNDSSLCVQELISILTRAFRFVLPPAGREDDLDRLPWVPDGLSRWDHWDTSVAIGYFGDDDGYGWGYQESQTCSYPTQWRVPTGRNVEVRKVRQWECSSFEIHVVGDENGGFGEQEVYRSSYCPASGPNIFLLEGCYWYLQAWLDPNLPPRLAFMNSVPSMSLVGELFEIVNSKIRPDVHQWNLPPVIFYGDIIQTWLQFQDYFLPARKGAKNTAAAIAAGLRDMELLPAFMKDFQCWLFVRPDVWPTWSNVHAVDFTVFTPSNLISNSNPFNLLPTELFLDIISQLHLPSLLALSSTSRMLRSIITEPSTLNKTIRRAISEGPLYWVLPVASVPGEVEAAAKADAEWISSVCTNADISRSTNITSGSAARPFSSLTFPYLTFIRACYESDSMMNRKRLWDNVKQFDILWRNYRLHGWENDIFVR